MSEDNPQRIVWFVAGAALGVAVALMLTPKSGVENRRRISRKAGEGRETLAGSGRELLDRSRDLFDKGRKIADEAAEIFERGRELVQG